jgi:endonuclease YncB( thermonuclease family)
MFFFLRKVFILLCLCLAAWLLLQIYQRREVFQPLWIYLEVWLHSKPAARQFVGTLAGKATKVVGGDVFFLKCPDGQYYTCKLTGVAAPGNPVSGDPEQKGLMTNSTAFLSSLILSNEVEINLTMVNEQHIAYGIVEVARTNINLAMVAAGHARLKREALADFPLKTQYQYVMAEKAAQRLKLGIWKQP